VTHHNEIDSSKDGALAADMTDGKRFAYVKTSNDILIVLGKIILE
jgi:hypothetical protein